MQKIDFSVFDKLAGQQPVEEPTREPVKGEAAADPLQEEPLEAVEALETQETTQKKAAVYELERAAERNKEAREKAELVYREYLRNVNQTQTIQTEILKGLAHGQDIYGLFLQAVKGLAIMLKDDQFYTQAEETLGRIYGDALLEREPLEMQLAATEQRRDRLLAAQDQATDTADKMRLRKAIEAQEADIARIRDKIKASEQNAAGRR